MPLIFNSSFSNYKQGPFYRWNPVRSKCLHWPGKSLHGLEGRIFRYCRRSEHIAGAIVPRAVREKRTAKRETIPRPVGRGRRGRSGEKDAADRERKTRPVVFEGVVRIMAKSNGARARLKSPAVKFNTVQAQ